MVRSWRYARLSPIIWHRIHVTYPDIPGWGLSPRGAGYLFGADITKAFAYNNAIDLIARAHQLAMEGFKLMFDQTIVTVWSAPNYCYRCVTISFIWPWARSSSFSAWLHMCTHIHTKGGSRLPHHTSDDLAPLLGTKPYPPHLFVFPGYPESLSPHPIGSVPLLVY